MTNQLIAGPAGALEVALDLPAGDAAPRALVVSAHPHPLHGGTMDNKVTTTLARACTSVGCAVVRFNYRGVGQSQGAFDNARGEVDDAAAALAWLQSQYSQHSKHPNAVPLPVVLCGFSFGTAVVAQLAQRLPAHQLVAMVLAGAAVQRFAADITVNPEHTLLIHGELDETVPLSETLAWCAPQSMPVVVIPTADHFFNRQLITLKQLAVRHLTACLGKV